MALTNFIPRQTLVTANWLNQVDILKETIGTETGSDLVGYDPNTIYQPGSIGYAIQQGIIAGNFVGTWNANTNNPLLTSGVGSADSYYIVSTAGTTTLDGISSWAVGDQVRFNGTVWQKVPYAGAAAASAVSFDPYEGITATDVQAALEELEDEKAPLAAPIFTDTAGGTAVLRITSGGNVGVGIPIPSGTYGKFGVLGTGTQSTYVQSTDASGVIVQVQADGSTGAEIGTVSDHPVQIKTNDTARLTFTSNKIQALFDSTFADRTSFQTSTLNANTNVQVVPNGTATTAGYVVLNTPNPLNSPYGQVAITSTAVNLVSGKLGSGTTLPFRMVMDGVNAIEIETNQKTTIPKLQFTQSGTGAVAINQQDKSRQIVNALDYGLVRDVVSYGSGAAITSGTAVLTVSGATFTAADVGKLVGVTGAGVATADLLTSIVGFTSSTQVTLAANASTTVTNAAMFYVTDSTTALQNALTAISGAFSQPACLTIPAGNFYISAALNVPTNVSIFGENNWLTRITQHTVNVPIFSRADAAGGGHITFSDLFLGYSGIPTVGANAIELVSTQNCILNNLFINASWNGIAFTGGTTFSSGNHFITNYFCYNYQYSGLYIENTIGVAMRNFQMAALSATGGQGGGIRIVGNSEGINISGGECQRGLYGLVITSRGTSKGSWNASTNSPALSNATGTKDDYYIVSTAGSAGGFGTFVVGDQIIYIGDSGSGTWQKGRTRSQVPHFNRFEQVFFDSNATNPVFLEWASNTDFVGCWFASGGYTNDFGNLAASSGILCQNASFIRVNGGEVINNGGYGVEIRSNSTDISFGSRTLFQQNGGYGGGISLPDGLPAVYVWPNTNKFYIDNCIFDPYNIDDTNLSCQRASVVVGGGTSNYYSISGNAAYLQPYSDGGTGTVKHVGNNVGLDIYNGNYSPVGSVTSPGMTPPVFTTSNARYIVKDGMCKVHFDVIMDTTGTGSGYVQLTLPPGFPSSATAQPVYYTGVWWSQSTGFTGISRILGTSATTVELATFINGYPGANSTRFVGFIEYAI